MRERNREIFVNRIFVLHGGNENVWRISKFDSILFARFAGKSRAAKLMLLTEGKFQMRALFCFEIIPKVNFPLVTKELNRFTKWLLVGDELRETAKKHKENQRKKKLNSQRLLRHQFFFLIFCVLFSVSSGPSSMFFFSLAQCSVEKASICCFSVSVCGAGAERLFYLRASAVSARVCVCPWLFACIGEETDETHLVQCHGIRCWNETTHEKYVIANQTLKLIANTHQEIKCKQNDKRGR